VAGERGGARRKEEGKRGMKDKMGDRRTRTLKKHGSQGRGRGELDRKGKKKIPV
jgi:hypothetical protein